MPTCFPMETNLTSRRDDPKWCKSNENPSTWHQKSNKKAGQHGKATWHRGRPKIVQNHRILVRPFTDLHCLGDPKSFKIIENRLRSLFGASWGQALRQPLRQPLRQALRRPPFGPHVGFQEPTKIVEKTMFKSTPKSNASQNFFGCQHGSKLPSKINQNSIKNRCHNRSKI